MFKLKKDEVLEYTTAATKGKELTKDTYYTNDKVASQVAGENQKFSEIFVQF